MKNFIKQELSSIIKKLVIVCINRAEVILGAGKGPAKLDLATKYSLDEMQELSFPLKIHLIKLICPFLFRDIVKEIVQDVFDEVKSMALKKF